MLNTSSLRRVVVLFLLAILAVPLIAAAGPARGDSHTDRTFLAADLLDRFWSFLKSTWSEEGCHIDPSGGCAPATNQEPQPGSDADTGHMIDPDGRS